LPRRTGERGFVPPDCAFARSASADRRAAAGGGSSALMACAAEIGFAPPKSAQPRGGGDRGPRVASFVASFAASFADIGFVSPNAPQPCGGGDLAPRVAAWPRRGRDPRGIERPDGRLSPRQRAALVALEPHQPRRDVAGGREPFGHDLRAHAADAGDIDLRLGDAQRGGAARLARILPGDPSRQGGRLRRERRIGEHRLVEPVAQRVARALALAGGRARPGAARRIGAVGGVHFFIDAWRCGRMGIEPAAIAGEVSTMPAPPTLPRKRASGRERHERGREPDLGAHLISPRAGHAGSFPAAGTRVNCPSSTGARAARSAASAAARARSAARRLSIAWRAAARRSSAAASMRSMRSN